MITIARWRDVMFLFTAITDCSMIFAFTLSLVPVDFLTRFRPSPV